MSQANPALWWRQLHKTVKAYKQLPKLRDALLALRAARAESGLANPGEAA
jgi:hypothetical protein